MSAASGDLTMRDVAPGEGALPFGSDATVAVSVKDARALIETLIRLDGQVRAILLISYAQPASVVDALAEEAGASALVTDRADLNGMPPQALRAARRSEVETRWLMTTSGTTGQPKIVPHTLKSLARTVSHYEGNQQARWGLLYDPTRFAGMQVVLQAVIGRAALIAPDLDAPLAEQVATLHQAGCSHLSATPTLWRRLLMVPQLKSLPLKQITLGGEIVDQQILDALRAAFPDTRITHIYASTEAGVGFSVNDGKAGFPVSYFDRLPGGTKMENKDNTLHFHLADGQSVNSGDRVKIEGERAYFLGRDNGMINVGGVKIYPEGVERVIMDVPGVALARIYAKSSPITGALVAVDVMPDGEVDKAALKKAIQTHCKAHLEREAVPAIIRIVPDLEVSAAGKIIRKTEGGAA
ncbi:AMP-binding protein [Paracoccaceae bacterium GXU_MW_L88]